MRTSMEDQLQLDDEANSEIADGGATSSRLPSGTSVGDLSVSSGSAPQLILQTLGSGPTPPVLLFYKINRVQVKSVMYTVIQF